MNCPKCNYPNPQGATHCGMCYEVFNRSAADAYLRQARRDRMEREREEGISPADISPLEPPRPVVVDEPAPPLVDWTAAQRTTTDFVKTRWKPLAIGAAVLFALWGAAWLRSPEQWIRLVGCRMTYLPPGKTPARYLATFTSNFRSWAERNRQLSTPLDDFLLDELGNLTLASAKSADKKTWVLEGRPEEWIRTVRRDSALPRGQTLSPADATLAGGRVLFDRRGKILKRAYPANPRMGRALHFLLPEVPNHRLRQGQSWTQRVEWTDWVGSWKIHWSGQVTWTLADLLEFDSRSMLTANGQGKLRAQVLAGPGWAQAGIKRARAVSTPMTSQMEFDRKRGRIIGQNIVYQASLRVPLDSLARIPPEIRVGRAVRAPGEVVLDLHNRLDFRER